jgi:CheY-like chemotaxis protein
MEIKQETTPLKILLADDDMDDRIFFEKALSEMPLVTTLHTVKNGDQLMEYLLQRSKQLPDILFLDLSMPRKTGFECLSEIKENEDLKALTVVMLTTSFTRGFDLEENLKTTLTRMGAHAYIRKPPDFNELKAVLHNCIVELISKKDNQYNKNSIDTYDLAASLKMPFL